MGVHLNVRGVVVWGAREEKEGVSDSFGWREVGEENGRWDSIMRKGNF